MLRVGVMLESYDSSAWVAKSLLDMQSSGFIHLELVVLDDQSARKTTLLKNRNRRLSLWLVSLYERWDYRRNKEKHDSTAPSDLSDLLSGIPSIQLGDAPGGVSSSQLAVILKYDLDVLVCFSLQKPYANLRGAARYGVWSFQHGDSIDSQAPTLLRELFERCPVSRSTLQMTSEWSEGSLVIYESYGSIDQLSLYGSRNQLYWKAAEFVLRRMRDLDAHGLEYIRRDPSCKLLLFDESSEPWTPRSLQVVLFMRRYLIRWLDARTARWRPGSKTKWYLAIRSKQETRRFDDPSGYRLMMSPTDRFYADPFLIEREGKTFLFFEDFRYATGRAVISCCELEPDGTPGETFEVLACPYHLSYPFVFEHDGEMYMIPETKEHRMVELYRATSFPSKWAFEAVLLNDVYAVDATVQKIDGKFWMFAGISDGRYSNSDELCVFFSDALTGPWTPHPRNPVVSDVRRARPAGRLFYDGGRFVRPSQDCGKAYGYALEFSEILILSETEYEERSIGRIDPTRVTGCIGTHTYNRTENFEVLDRTLPATVADRMRGNQTQ